MRFSERTTGFHSANAIAVLAQTVRGAGVDIINLSDSNPTVQGLVPPGVLESLASKASLVYHPDPRGLVSARSALAGYFGGNPDDYFLAASTSEAYSWLWKLLCNPGDSVLVPRPGYPLFDHLATLDSIKPVQYRLEYSHPHGWSIDIDEIRTQAKKSHARALVLINPNNPTGSYLSSSERRAVVDLCVELGMALVADEVFYQYALEADTDRARLGGENRCLTFSLDGLSKLLCLPQFKLGWIRISGPLSETIEASARLEVIADAYLSAGTPVMNALPFLLKRAGDFQTEVSKRLKKNLMSARLAFEEKGSPYRILRCEGGWTALLEYPRYLEEESMVLGLLAKKAVLVQPGYFFDMEKDGYLALSLILNPSRFISGINKTRQYIDSLKA